MTNLSDGFKDVFLAGVGAMAITGEKTKHLVDQLIAKGELTVDQGKEINSELRHKAEDVADAVRYDLLEARMSAMSAQERADFVSKVADIAEKANAQADGAAKVGDAFPVEACDSASRPPAPGTAPASPQPPAPVPAPAPAPASGDASPKTTAPGSGA